MATVKQVAQRSNVSPMIVSRVVNGSRRVSAKTRERVEQAIVDLGYVPNHLARSLATKERIARARRPRRGEPVLYANRARRGAGRSQVGLPCLFV